MFTRSSEKKIDLLRGHGKEKNFVRKCCFQQAICVVFALSSLMEFL